MFHKGIARPVPGGIVVLRKDLGKIFQLLYKERIKRSIEDTLTRANLNAERWRWIHRKALALLALERHL